MPSFQLFAQNLNESTAAYIARLDTYLQSLGAIGLQDVTLTKRLSLNAIRWEITLAYQTPGPLTFRAAYFSTLNGAGTVEAQAAAFFAANPTYRMHFIKDVSQERRRKLDHDAVLCIYTASVVPNCGFGHGRPVIVKATAAIGIGATGAARLVSSSGLLADSVNVVNRSGIAWAMNTMGYAVMRQASCVWDGYPTCCGP